MTLTELSADQIEAIRAGTRQPGHYKNVVTEFLNSNIQGADVTSEFPGRQINSVTAALKKQSRNAEFAGKVEVYSNENAVFLVRV